MSMNLEADVSTRFKTKSNLMDYIWGQNARPGLLLFGAAAMLLMMLGSHELWTQEWRWADISWNMIYSKDYLHPYLGNNAYYDKPLLSYWLMIFFSHLVGGLNEWALRLPPAIAGIVTVWCTYRLGSTLINQRMGLMAGWMLLTSYFFVFWARTANADMLNLAGTMLAILWYFEHKQKPGFFNFTIFFTILAVTALFKGLIGLVIPLIAILPDVIKNKNWQRYLHWSLIPALILPALIYIAPFWASTHFGDQQYSESGLYQVYRENVLRYFAPFDHQGPIYTYLIYLPLYTLPWALFLLPAVYSLRSRWSQMSENSRWMVWSTGLIFLFLTLSGSRRNYYVLPLVPFAILMTADWLAKVSFNNKKLSQWVNGILLLGYTVSFASFGIIQPLYYADGGLRPFAKEVQSVASHQQPWSQWNIVFLDTLNKLTLYLDPAHPVQLMNPPGGHAKNDAERAGFTTAQLATAWPMIAKPPANTIFVTRQAYIERLKPYFKNYHVIMAEPSLGERLLHPRTSDRVVAFIPNM